MIKLWRGGRVAEGARLESVYTGNRIEGSNPSLSAIYFTLFKLFLINLKNCLKLFEHNIFEN